MNDCENDSEIPSFDSEPLREKIKSLEKKLMLINSSFSSVVSKSLDGIVILDKRHMIAYINRTAIELFGSDVTSFLGKPFDLVIDVNSLLNSRDGVSKVTIPKSRGVEIVCATSVLQSIWNDEPCYVVIFRNITDHKNNQEMLEYMSNYDYLTKLPNRVYFERQMKVAIDEASQTRQHMALLYLDLDNFKMINDTLGHEVGDLLLKSVSDILTSSIRDIDTVARLGGDEFAIILHQLRKREYATEVSKKILDRLGQAVLVANKELYANASIGIAIYPESGKSHIDLVKNADTAMYDAKYNGKNQYRVYAQNLSCQSERNLMIANGLRNVLRKNQLFLQYQPIIDLKSGECAALEALLRWQHDSIGVIMPDDFLQLAHETGLLFDIGRWVFSQALTDFSQLASEHSNLSYIAINMSANELDIAKTSDLVTSVIKKSGVDTRKVVVELTETSIMRHPKSAIEIFQSLSDIGVKVAVDDYGTGHSSLSYLKRLPISILKIDKSFIRDIGIDSSDTIIVKSTIELAHNLGYKVVAEGVETKQQLDFLKKYNCDYVQGFYFSKSLSLDDLRRFLGGFTHHQQPLE